MIIYPAIDIRDGKCVRLIEGDFTRETVFDQDPAEAAKRWANEGATHLHVVDLDGARSGRPVNLDAITRMRSAVSSWIQVGGGIRSVADAKTLVDQGVDRLILGSAIVSDPAISSEIAGTFPGQVAAGLDARDGNVATDGWLVQSALTVKEAARTVVASGISTIIFTDIRKDGTLLGPNVEALRELLDTTAAEIIASGGIGSIEHVAQVAGTGAAGLIIGRALYDGRVRLADALRWQQVLQQQP